MIGLDTNVLLRLGDDKEPARKLRAGAFVRGLGDAKTFLSGPAESVQAVGGP